MLKKKLDKTLAGGTAYKQGIFCRLARGISRISSKIFPYTFP